MYFSRFLNCTDGTKSRNASTFILDYVKNTIATEICQELQEFRSKYVYLKY